MRTTPPDANRAHIVADPCTSAEEALRRLDGALRSGTHDQLDENLKDKLEPLMYDAVRAYLRADGASAALEGFLPAFESLVRLAIQNLVEFEEQHARGARDEFAGKADHQLGTNYALEVVGNEPATAFLKAWLKTHPAQSRSRTRATATRRSK